MHYEINLPKGRLVIQNSSDPAYPGVYVEYVSNNENDIDVSHPGVLVEFNKEDNELRALVWNDPSKEDYYDEIIFNHVDFLK